MSMTRKTLALVTTASLVIASNSPGQAPEKKTDVTPREVREALAKAHEIRVGIDKLEERSTRDAAEQEFKTLVTRHLGSFPEVPAAVGDKARYTKLTMNARGGGFDAFRFRVPSAGRTYQLFWSFSVPAESVEDQPIRALGILEVDGEQVMFTYPVGKKNVTIPGFNLPQPNLWTHYRLYDRKLQAGKEYVVWFDSKADQRWPIYVRVRIEPLETAEPPHTPALQAARGTFQASLDKLNQQYDDDVKTIRRKYLDELDRASKAIPKKNAARRQEIVAEADRANLGDSETSDPRGFHIIRAEIGVGDQWNDVTVPARNLVREKRLKVASPEYDFQPDAAFGVKKTLVIVYTIDGKPDIYTAPADRSFELPPPPSAVATPAKK
jgi:hypothetical protein